MFFSNNKRFAKLDSTYIADGHHRAASAVRVSLMRREADPDHTGDEEYNYFLSVLFPADQLKIMDYNRVIKTLNGLSCEELISKLSEKFEIGGEWLDAGTSDVAWTTTAWTLASNVALTCGPDIDYIRAKMTEGDEEGNIFYVEPAFYYNLQGFKDKRAEAFEPILKEMERIVKANHHVIFTGNFEAPMYEKEGFIYKEQNTIICIYLFFISILSSIPCTPTFW